MTNTSLPCTPPWGELSREALEAAADNYHAAFHEAAAEAIQREVELFELADSLNFLLGEASSIQAVKRVTRTGGMRKPLERREFYSAEHVDAILDVLIEIMHAAYVASGQTGLSMAQKEVEDEQFASMLDSFAELLGADFSEAEAPEAKAEAPEAETKA